MTSLHWPLPFICYMDSTHCIAIRESIVYVQTCQLQFFYTSRIFLFFTNFSHLMFLLCSFFPFLLHSSPKFIQVCIDCCYSDFTPSICDFFLLYFVPSLIKLKKLYSMLLSWCISHKAKYFFFTIRTSSMRRKWTNKRSYKSRKLNWTELIAELYNCCPCYVSKQPKNRKNNEEKSVHHLLRVGEYESEREKMSERVTEIERK